MENIKISDETPISFLTVKQLKEILGTTTQPTQQVVKTQNGSPEEYSFGMSGLKALFNVSHTTAWRLKTTVLKPAIIQHGRKFMIRKEEALKLFSESQEGGK